MRHSPGTVGNWAARVQNSVLAHEATIFLKSVENEVLVRRGHIHFDLTMGQNIQILNRLRILKYNVTLVKVNMIDLVVQVLQAVSRQVLEVGNILELGLLPFFVVVLVEVKRCSQT